jgi:pyridoxine 4-dehydrogenase
MSNSMTKGTQSVSAPGGTYVLGNYLVARVGYGAMQLPRCAANPAEAVALLEHAIHLGVDHIDTAHFYGNGFANEMIRRALRPGDGILVASKVGADPDPDGKRTLKIAQRPEQLRASLEDNLVSLGLEKIPLVYLRRPDTRPGAAAEGDQIVNIEDQMAVMIALRNEGKIGAIGLSGVTSDGLRRTLSAGIACVQNAYSLVSREYEDVLTFCLANNIAWIPFFPLGGAAPGWPKVAEQRTVIDIAARMNVTPMQVGLAWLLRHTPNTLLIPGTTSVKHLEENVAAAAVVLHEDAMAELSALEASV